MRGTQFSQHLRIVFPLICLLLTGCATPWVWEHPQKLGPEELQAATAECEQLAREEANRNDYFLPGPYPYFSPYPSRFNDYRYAYPYDYPFSFYYDSQRRFDDLQRFFRICMQAKGWRQVPATPPR